MVAPTASATNLQALTERPNSKRSRSVGSAESQLPLLTAIPREQLRHHTILPTAIEQRFQRIEREYATRDRLAHHGFHYKQKYGIEVIAEPEDGYIIGASADRLILSQAVYSIHTRSAIERLWIPLQSL